MKTTDLWMSRQAATELLGVRQQTLYAYVSRGLIRTRPDATDPRRSSYSKYDIQALVERKRGSRRRTDIATGAIAWGEPVLESAISTVRDGQLIFRGREAAELANRATLEEAAAVLWQCDVPDAATISRDSAARAAPSKSTSAKARAFDYLAAMANTQPPSYGRSETLQQTDAWALLYGFADTLAGEATSGLIHQRLASAWGLDARGADIVRRALVLIADHELNASTFAVRVAASTGASLAASALAGFCALVRPTARPGLGARAGAARPHRQRRGCKILYPRAGRARRAAARLQSSALSARRYPRDQPAARAEGRPALDACAAACREGDRCARQCRHGARRDDARAEPDRRSAVRAVCRSAAWPAGSRTPWSSARPAG